MWWAGGGGGGCIAPRMLAGWPRGVLVPLVVASAIVMIDAWVYLNAREHSKQGSPVYFRACSLEVDRPEVWVLGCLVLWIIFFSIYMLSRQ